MKRIAIIVGHPDPMGGHLCHALAKAYADGARSGGHDVRVIEVGKLGFPLMTNRDAWENGELPSSLRDAQNDLLWAQHYCFAYPLWHGDMPAKLKGFLEQVLRPGLGQIANLSTLANLSSMGWDKFLKGKSARLIVTMAMPASVYRMFYRAHTVKSFERNILRFVGVSPVRQTLIGRVHDRSPEELRAIIDDVAGLGKAAR